MTFEISKILSFSWTFSPLYMDEKNHNKTATPEQPAATLYRGWAGPRGAPGTGAWSGRQDWPVAPA